MADLPGQRMKRRFPYVLSTRPYLHDHSFEGKAVFPAVEALITLARAVQNHSSGAHLLNQASAQFSRMLVIDPAREVLDVQIEIEAAAEGISASLWTVMHGKSSAMVRALEHARVTFVQEDAPPKPVICRRSAGKLEGECIHVPAVSVYRELIPFGLSYQNMVGDLSVSMDGAVAEIAGGGGEADESLLGSPFVLDAAMHAACVWAQRFTDIVAFPVGIDRRIIYAPTKKGGSYLARVKPVETSRDLLVFDVWIFDQDGILCEDITGLRMRDVTQGRMRPPRWIREGI
ncbi:MAG: hypothetical protein EG826_10210 [Deltaproteobacteria bacterium]|nr:hypothetical protein [Deltaproteobacteria bacterium]